MNPLTSAGVGVRKFFNASLDIYIYGILAIVLVVTFYPFWYILVYSLSDPARPKPGFLLLPAGFSLEAYAATLANNGILHAFFVSVARSVIGPVTSVAISMLVGYTLSRVDLPFRRPLSIYFIVTMYFGAGLIPVYLLIKSLGLINSFWLYIVPGFMNVYAMILLRTYIESLPGSLIESAYLDGANDLTIFSRIVVPLCIPVIAAVTLFSAVGHWNSYTDTLIYNSAKEELYTLQYVLVILVSSVAASRGVDYINDLANNQHHAALSPMSVRMAITIITVIPISLIYPVLQRYFVKGILIGAVKG
jgi:putative aldouronate transport system permease protein